MPTPFDMSAAELCAYHIAHHVTEKRSIRHLLALAGEHIAVLTDLRDTDGAVLTNAEHFAIGRQLAILTDYHNWAIAQL